MDLAEVDLEDVCVDGTTLKAEAEATSIQITEISFIMFLFRGL